MSIIFGRRVVNSIQSIHISMSPCSHKHPRNLHQASHSIHTAAAAKHTPHTTPITPIVSTIATSTIPTTPITTPRPRRKQSLQSKRNPHPKLLENLMHSTPRTHQRHHHSHKSLERVSLRILPELAYQALEFVD
jgi:hypothetical protein